MELNIEIYKDESPSTAASYGQSGRWCWSFRVDGRESGFWSLTKEAVERCVNRLSQGRSREAFGDVVDIMASGNKIAEARIGPYRGRATIEKMEEPTPKSPKPKPRTMASGKVKATPTRTMHKAKVDGIEIGVYESESKARRACAFAAFMTRGRMILHGKTIETTDGTKIACHFDGKSLIGTSTKGEKYAIGYDSGGNHRIKKIIAEGE